MILAGAAEQWDHAMPTGNGQVGAMVFGDVQHETILLNHDSLFIRSEKPILPDVSKHVPKMRRMIAEGRYLEAQQFFEGKIRERYDYRGPDSFHPAFNATIDMPTADQITDERRSVNFETGEVSVTWKQEGVTYKRSAFVSRKDDVVVISIRASKPGMINGKIGLLPTGLNRDELGDGKNVRVPRFPVGLRKPKIRLQEVPITFNLSAAEEKTPALPKDGSEGFARSAGFASLLIFSSFLLTLLAKYDIGGTYHMVGGEYGGCTRVMVEGGSAETSNLQVNVEHADEALIIIKLFANEESAAAVKRIRGELEQLDADYNVLLERHVELHRELFLRVKFDLNGEEELRTLANEELMNEVKHGKGLHAMIERLFDFGRYALICSSRAGGMPANLQGVWNGYYGPDWASDYHNDINVQMNYFQALPGNMAEIALPYFDLYESLLEDYRTNARNIYGCRGILAPICGGTTHGLMYSSAFISWTAGAGWLAQLFYDYWLYTGDRNFLQKRALPYMKEVALFYDDFLIEGEDGKYLFSPSHSPENSPSNSNSSCVVNATMDIAVAKELLRNLCSACELLGIEEENTMRWRNMLAKLPDYMMDEEGALKEWAHANLNNNDGHRHMSHLYPVFPGWEAIGAPEPHSGRIRLQLFEACRVAMLNKMRQMAHPCTWTNAQAACTYARLEEADLAFNALEDIARKTYLLPNLLTTLYSDDPMMQFEASSGIPAAVMEMLLFSEPGMIRLLPALPRAWPTGHVKGLRARGGFEVDIDWKDGKLNRAIIHSLLGNTCKICYGDKMFELKAQAGESCLLNGSTLLI